MSTSTPLLLTVVAGAALAVAAPSPAAATDDAALRKDILKARVALAESKEIYLVLDAGAGEIRLEIQNVVLHRFPATLRVGRPHEPGGGPLAWPALVYTLTEGGAEKPREQIQPPDPATVAADSSRPAPPAENLLEQRERMRAALPANYVLRFSPDLALLVESDHSGRDLWDGFAIRWRHALARLKQEPLPLRVIASMGEDDARRLSVALQQGMSMLVLPAGPPAGDDANGP